MAITKPAAWISSNSSDTAVHDRNLQSYFPLPPIADANNAIEQWISADYIEEPVWRPSEGPYVPMSNCDEHIESKIAEIHRLRLLIRTAGIKGQTSDNRIPLLVKECSRQAQSARDFIRSQWWRDVKRLPVSREMDISAAKALQPNPIVRWWKNTHRKIEEKAMLRAKKIDEVRDKRLAVVYEALEMLDKHRVMIMIGENDFIWNPNCCKYLGVMQGQPSHGRIGARHIKRVSNGVYHLKVAFISYAGATYIPSQVRLHKTLHGRYLKPNIHWIPREGDNSSESYIQLEIIVTDEGLAEEQYMGAWHEDWADQHTPTRQEKRTEEGLTAEFKRRECPVRMFLHKLYYGY